MTTWGDRLRAADPLGLEAGPDDHARTRMRVAVLAAGRTIPVSRRRVFAPAVAAVAVVLVGGVAAGTRAWRALDAPVHAAVRFEVHLAETTPSPGLREAPVGTEPTVVYLHEEVVLTNDDIVSAAVVAGATADRFAVTVRLSPAGSARLRAATRAHIGRPVAFVLDGLVVMAPTVRSEIAHVGIVTGALDRAAAERMAAGLRAR